MKTDIHYQNYYVGMRFWSFAWEPWNPWIDVVISCFIIVSLAYSNYQSPFSSSVSITLWNSTKASFGSSSFLAVQIGQYYKNLAYNEKAIITFSVVIFVFEVYVRFLFFVILIIKIIILLYCMFISQWEAISRVINRVIPPLHPQAWNRRRHSFFPK